MKKAKDKYRGYRIGTIAGVLHQFFDDGEIVRVEPDPVLEAEVKAALKNLERRGREGTLPGQRGASRGTVNWDDLREIEKRWARSHGYCDTIIDLKNGGTLSCRMPNGHKGVCFTPANIAAHGGEAERLPTGQAQKPNERSSA